MMMIHAIALCRDRQTDATMLCQSNEHMIEKIHACSNLNGSTIEIQVEFDTRFSRDARNATRSFRAAHIKPRWLAKRDDRRSERTDLAPGPHTWPADESDDYR